MNLDKALAVSLEAVHDAGLLTLGYFGRALEVQVKDDASPVTEADVRAEELIRSRLERAFPDHGIQGEEHGLSSSMPSIDFQRDEKKISSVRRSQSQMPSLAPRLASE